MNRCALGYVLKLNQTEYRQKLGTQVALPFFVPPKRPIRPLLGNGEIFHARAKELMENQRHFADLVEERMRTSKAKSAR